MKFRYFYFVLLLLTFFSISCRDNVVDFDPAAKTGDLYINSKPEGATIFFNDTRTGKITPDSLVNLQPGNYMIRVTLLGVGEGETYVNVESGQKKHININIY